ncbi:hypothetical protein [Massilia rhizosphaerae]|uniref:hypothetical protein n=1 Tax=Massilia rhizosphaerae TaxID=2784389 RepID=UPI0018DEB08B|nr:hypothetical protein [Massilia rhizosphaerae]
MTETKKPQAPERGVKQMCDLAILNLATCHAELRPGSTTKDFLREVMDMVAKHDSPSVVDPIGIIMQFLGAELRAKGVDWVAAQPFGPILVSAAYCVRARANIKSGFNELAWSNMADAMFWCGVANTSKGVGALISEVQTEARAEGEAQAASENAKSGAAARSDAWQPIREFALRYARRPGMKWDSRSHAAEVIAKATMEFCNEQKALADAKAAEIKVEKQKAREAGKAYQGDDKVTRLPNIKPKSFGRTVDGWLKDMPDAVNLFPSSRTLK